MSSVITHPMTRSDLMIDVIRYWKLFNWNRGELLSEDKDEREEHYTMTTEYCNHAFIGTGIYSSGELIKITDIDITN